MTELIEKNKKEEYNEEDIDRETALAKAIEGLIVNDPEKAQVLTDLRENQVKGLASLYTFEKWLNTIYPIKSNVFEKFTDKFILFMISKNRKSRQELVAVLKEGNKEEENKKNFLEKLKNVEVV